MQQTTNTQTSYNAQQNTQQDQNVSSNQPEAKFNAGAVSATIWKNEFSGKDGQKGSYHTVSLQRSYKDKQGNWQNTSSLRINDLPKAQLVLAKAYEFLILRDQESD